MGRGTAYGYNQDRRDYGSVARATTSTPFRRSGSYGGGMRVGGAYGMRGGYGGGYGMGGYEPGYGGGLGWGTSVEPGWGGEFYGGMGGGYGMGPDFYDPYYGQSPYSRAYASGTARGRVQPTRGYAPSSYDQAQEMEQAAKERAAEAKAMEEQAADLARKAQEEADAAAAQARAEEAALQAREEEAKKLETEAEQARQQAQASAQKAQEDAARALEAENRMMNSPPGMEPGYYQEGPRDASGYQRPYSVRDAVLAKTQEARERAYGPSYGSRRAGRSWYD